MEMVHFYVDVYVDNGSQSYFVKSMYHPPYQSEIELSYNFTSQGTPSSTEFTLHGLTKEHAAIFTEKATVKIRAGWFSSDGLDNMISDVVTGTIKSVEPLHNDAGDIQLTVTLQDGTSYDNLKEIKVAKSELVRSSARGKSNSKQIKAAETQHRNLVKTYRQQHGKMPRAVMASEMKRYRAQLKSIREQASRKAAADNKEKVNKEGKRIKTVYKALAFKKNTKGSTIIQQLATKAGINIHTLKLVHDKVFKNGYTASKRPMACIKEVAGECDTNVYYQHGNLMVQSFVQRKKLDVVISNETGLLQPPSYQADSETNNTWELQLAFRPEITTGSVFYLNHPALHGWVIALNGSASLQTGDTPTLTVDVQLFSDYKASEAKKLNNEKAKEKKADEKQKKVSRAKRASRQKHYVANHKK